MPCLASARPTAGIVVLGVGVVSLIHAVGVYAMIRAVGRALARQGIAGP